LIEYLPSIIKTKDWELLFTPNKDGVSMSTFYDRTKDWKLTLIVVQDTTGYIFGGYCTEYWKQSTKFYGTGENFLFTFRDGNKPTIFRWTGEND
jgi:hypothetical protein